MPRNSNGDYSLPAGNPVVTGEVISSGWANTTLGDIATALTGSLSRNGEGAMLAGLELYDGTIGAPGLTWGTETTSGLYRAGAGDFRWAINGVDVVTITSAGISDGSLSSNVVLKNTANTFTDSPQTITANNARVVAGDGTYQALAGIVSGDGGAFGTLSNHITRFYTNATDRGSISAAGNWVINAPSSGRTLDIKITAATGATPMRLTDGTIIADFTLSGGLLQIGTASASGVLLFTAGNNRLQMANTGGVQIGIPTGGDKGSGTLNTAGAIYQNDVAVPALPAVTSTSTTLVVGQAHYITGNATLPALTAGQWVSIINNSGSAITISGSGGYTTYWTASGASVSTVTLAARGRLFAEGVGSSVVYVSGDITGST